MPEANPLPKVYPRPSIPMPETYPQSEAYPLHETYLENTPKQKMLTQLAATPGPGKCGWWGLWILNPGMQGQHDSTYLSTIVDMPHTQIQSE